MKKMFYIMMSLLSATSNTAFDLSKIQSIAPQEHWLVRKNVIRTALSTRFPEVIVALIMPYMQEFWHMRSMDCQKNADCLPFLKEVEQSSDKKYTVYFDKQERLTLHNKLFSRRRLAPVVPLYPLEKVIKNSCERVSFFPNNHLIAAFDPTIPVIYVWNVRGQLLRSISAPDECKEYNVLEALADDDEFALASYNSNKQLLIGKSIECSDGKHQLNITQRMERAIPGPLGIVRLQRLGDGQFKSVDVQGVTRNYAKTFD